MTAPLTEAQVREIVRGEIAADRAADEARRAEASQHGWRKFLAGIQDDLAKTRAGVEPDQFFVTEAGVRYPKADLVTIRGRLLPLANARAAKGDIEGANEIRAVFGLPLLDERGQHAVDVVDPQLQGSQGVDDAGEHRAAVVGVRLSALGVDDSSDVGDQLVRDRGGVTGSPAAEVEGVSERHDASPSFDGLDPTSVGAGRPGPAENVGPGHAQGGLS